MGTDARSEVRVPAGRSIGTVIVAMALIEALSGITQGYINPLLPALGPVLSIDDATINGIFLLSQLGFAVLTPIISTLGDSWGYRPVLRASILLVAAGVVLMAVHPTLWTVMVGVVLLTGVVGFIPLMMGILRSAGPGRLRAGVSSMIAVLMVTVGVGGLLAGLVGMHTPTRGFWVAVPFAVAALALVPLLPEGGSPTRERIAVVPLLACSLGLTGFVTALSMGADWGWTDPRVLASGGCGVLLLAVWVRRDSTRNHTFVDLSMFRLRQVRVVSGATFFFGFASISYISTNAIFLFSDASTAGYGFGLSSLQIASLFLIVSMTSFVASLLTTRLLRVAGERATLVGAGLVLCAAFAVMGLLHRSLPGYCVGLALFGLGLGLYQASTRALAVEGVDPGLTATAAGINELALSIGIVVGAAVVKLLSSAFLSGGSISSRGLVAIWVTLAAGGLAASLTAMRYVRPAAVGPDGVAA
ncbi:MFS transporter [Streptomyces sp. NPDC002458]|uniref:MFS transporter n=1 Tax=Streptomyces sp. NPDC002458 TaxID=3364644 RepID=UPI00369D1E44